MALLKPIFSAIGEQSLNSFEHKIEKGCFKTLKKKDDEI